MAEHTSTTMDGLRKEVYGDKLEDAVPSETSVCKSIKFVARNQLLGNNYNVPVRLTRSHGWTVNTGGTAYALNAAEPCVTQNAQVQGISFTVRESIANDMLAWLGKGSRGDQKRSFVSATSYIHESMSEIAMFIREIAVLYGSANIGITSGQQADNGTSQTFTFTAATFIPALWSGLENGYVDCWDTTEATQRNPTGTMKVTAVDIENRRVTFLGTEAEMDAIVDTDRFFLRGFLGLSLVGLYDLFTNSTTLFGVNGATYSLFKGNTHAAGSAQLTFATILQAMNRIANRGFRGKLDCYISSASWNDANNSLAALRRYGEKAGGKVEQGATGIEYHTHSGTVVLHHHLLMQPSMAALIPSDKCKRVGSTDVTFKLPGLAKDAFFAPLADNAGVQMRAMFNQAVFSAYPAHGCWITGLVNSDQ